MTDTHNLRDRTDPTSKIFKEYDEVTQEAIKKLCVYGMPPDNIYYQGAFTDGMNLSQYLISIMRTNVIVYSVGGANVEYNKTMQVNPEVILDALNLTNLNMAQHVSKSLYSQFAQFKEDIHSKLQLEQSDVVLLLMGGNDMMMHIQMEPLDFVNTIRNFIKSIMNLGIKHLVLTNVLPVDIAVEYQYYLADDDSNSRSLTTHIKEVNQMMIPLVHEFKQQGLDVILYDINEVINKIYNQQPYMYRSAPCYYGSAGMIYNPKKGNFRKRTDADENIYINGLYKAMKDNVKLGWQFKLAFENTVCPDSERHKYMFYDKIHPTTRMHLILAKNICSFIRDNSSGLIHKCYNDVQVKNLDIPDLIKNPTKKLFWEKLYYYIFNDETQNI